MSVHAAAQGFGSVADSYQRGRPEYPDAMIEWMLALTGVGPLDRVVDLGAGTGKFTKSLVERGLNVTAVEPVDEMRTQLSLVLPDIEALSTPVQDLTFADESVDLVTCAQSFHWFADTTSIAQIARILRPEHYLVLVWNQKDLSDPVQAVLEAQTERYQDPAVPHSMNRRWKFAIDTAPQFMKVGERHFAHEQQLARLGVVDRLRSTSLFASSTPDLQQRLLEELEAVVPDVETVALHYITEAYAYRRVGPPRTDELIV